MKHTYHVTGMTCGNCKAAVESALNSIDEITKAEVDLEKGEVAVTMKSHVSLQKMLEVLPKKYAISEKEAMNVFGSARAAPEKSKLAQLKPLFLIIGYITVAAVLLNYTNWNISNAMLDFMGLFYIVFGFFKLLDLRGFKESFQMYDPLAKAIPAYGWIYPFIETALGLLFLMRLELNLALILTLVVLGITTIGVTKTLLSKKSIQCACLGTALKLPMTEATFIENAIMIIMAIFMLS